MFNRIFVFVCCLWLISCGPSRDEVESQLKSWLSEHQDEWLPVALKKVEERTRKKVKEREKGPFLEDIKSKGKSENPLASFEVEGASLGSSSAAIKMTVIVSYLNSINGQFFSILDRLMEEFGDQNLFIRFIFLPTPGVFIEREERAVRAITAASEMGRFQAMHAILKSKTGDQTDQDLVGFAKRVGLDSESFKSKMDSVKTRKYIQDIEGLSKENGIYFGPIAYINGYRFNQILKYSLYEELISQLLSEAGQ